MGWFEDALPCFRNSRARVLITISTQGSFVLLGGVVDRMQTASGVARHNPKWGTHG